MADRIPYPQDDELDILDSIIEMELRLAKMRQRGQKLPGPVEILPDELNKEAIADEIEMGGGINIHFGEPAEAPRAWRPPMEMPLPPVNPMPQEPRGFNWGDIQRNIGEGNSQGFTPILPPN